MLDESGEDCVVGQQGPIWFLAGPFGGGEVERECSIPAGKRLFFPLINSIAFDTPGVCGQEGSLSVAELRTNAADQLDNPENLSVTLDNQSISSFRRTRSPVFEIALPEDNVFDAICEGLGLGNVPGGIYSPAVEVGFYVLLHPLSPGEHVLKFYAEIPGPEGAVVDVTYVLTVVPVTVR
jgi:hypothetical protein